MNLMKTAIQIIFALLFVVKKTEGQNLVINGDFKQCAECPENPGQLELCTGWYIPNNSTPDLLKKCPFTKSYVNVPFNANGYQEPNSGDAYIGIVLIHSTTNAKNYREYIQGELSESLRADKYYNISFYISWADYSNYFCDRIGYLFTDSKIVPDRKEPEQKKTKRKSGYVEQEPLNTILPRSNGFVSLNFDEIKDKESWHKVEFIYQAKGGEKYFTFGLFGDNATEDDYKRYIGKVYQKPSNVGASAYFYIDDVSVVPIDGKIEFTHEH